MKSGVVEFSERVKLDVIHFSEVCKDLCFQNGHIPSIEVTSGAPDIAVGWPSVSAGIERRILKKLSIRTEPFMILKKQGLQSGLSFGLQFSN
ncbi:MAG: hypothetical protein R2778_01330 [Saprospiraceae bacterium]